MKLGLVVALALSSAALPAGLAQAACFPVKSEIVSLGEKAARYYADRSLAKAIDEQKTSAESSGAQIGRIVKSDLACAPFPNVIGADEWRCTGEAKFCTGTAAASAGRVPAKKAKSVSLPAKTPAKQKPKT